MSLDPQRAKSIFLAALDQPAEARAAFLEEACAGAPELRQRVVELLEAHDRPDTITAFPPSASSPSGNSGPTAGSDPRSPRDGAVERPGAIIGPYKLLQEIGEGGMGTVYMAEQTHPVQRKVALKLVKPGMDSRQMIARFEAERQALALMDHPNIARVLDAGTTDSGRPYFVMELVKGVPITKYCDEHRLTPRERLELFVPVCQAVQHAHHKGVIHRDLKPSNVLVCVYDGKPVPKVIDFGVAKAAGYKLTERTLFTEFGAIIGTLEYMSPEQAVLDQLDVDTRSDVYSLGVLLYELLTGTTPLDRKRMTQAALLELLRLVREQDVPAPSTRLSTLDGLPMVAANRGTEPRKLSALIRGELDWIVLKALEKERGRRYESPHGLADDIERFLRNEAVQACPPSAWYQLTKFARRNVLVLAPAAMVLLALVAGIIGTTWGMLQANTARGEAVKAQRAEARRADSERQAKQEALDREAETKAVLDFVENRVFAAARPKDMEGGLGFDVKLADAIKAALPFVDKGFAGQPLIQARLRRMMGKSFAYLGDLKTAIEQFQAARALNTAHRGPRHPDTLIAMNNLAAAYDEAGRSREALELREETLRLQTATLGPEHGDTIRSMTNLAISYYVAGQTQDAIRLGEQALALSRSKLGISDPRTGMVLNNLANAYVQAGRSDDAITLLKDAIALSTTKLGPHHPDTLIAMNNLANAYATMGRSEDALALRKKILPLIRAELGPNHFHTFIAMNNLANSHFDTGQTEEAAKLFAQTLELEKANLGAGHRLTLTTMGNLANALAVSGRHQDALALLEETLPLQRTQMGAKHPLTLQTMGNLATTYSEVGRARDAVKLYDETIEAQKASLGAGHPNTLHTMNDLAGSLIGGGEVERASRVLQEVLTLRAQRIKDQPTNTLELCDIARTHGQIGEAEQGRLNFPAAIRSFVKSVEMFEELDRKQALTEWFYRTRLVEYRQRLAACQNTERAVKDLDFALRQPADDVPRLLYLRVQILLRQQDLSAAAESAAKLKERAGDRAELLYDAACGYAVCASAAKQKPDRSAGAPESESLAGEAIALLRRAMAHGFRDAAHMKQDPDLAALRERQDFKSLIVELEGQKDRPALSN
jgi:serine/threonine protein kinase/tetratricopeptide (TPR) repeat protein